MILSILLTLLCPCASISVQFKPFPSVVILGHLPYFLLNREGYSPVAFKNRLTLGNAPKVFLFNKTIYVKDKVRQNSTLRIVVFSF